MRKLKLESSHQNNAITEWYVFAINPISSNINWNDQTCELKNRLVLLRLNYYLSYHVTYQTDNKELSLEMINKIWKNQQQTLFKTWRLDKIDDSRYIINPFYISGQNHWYIGIFLLSDHQNNPCSLEIKNIISKRLVDKPSNISTINILINLDCVKSSNFNLLDYVENMDYFKEKKWNLPTTEKRKTPDYLVISTSNIIRNLRNYFPCLEQFIP